MNTTMYKTANTFHRIAIIAGGGNAPGLNAVIHAVVHAAHIHGWEIRRELIAFRCGWRPPSSSS
jgi:6-phosphofructokinase